MSEVLKVANKAASSINDYIDKSIEARCSRQDEKIEELAKRTQTTNENLNSLNVQLGKWNNEIKDRFVNNERKIISAMDFIES